MNKERELMHARVKIGLFEMYIGAIDAILRKVTRGDMSIKLKYEDDEKVVYDVMDRGEKVGEITFSSVSNDICYCVNEKYKRIFEQFSQGNYYLLEESRIGRV